MEAQRIENSEDFKQLIARYFTTMKPANDKTDIYTTEIRVSSYCELSYIISNMLKLCIQALDHERCKDSSIDIALLLKVVVQLLPLEEIEFLDEINKRVVMNADCKDLESVIKK